MSQNYSSTYTRVATVSSDISYYRP